jgi:hypothetical protein
MISWQTILVRLNIVKVKLSSKGGVSMAMFHQGYELSELQIKNLSSQIENQEGATNVSFLETTNSFYVFQGSIANKLVKFNIDKTSGMIVTEED